MPRLFPIGCLLILIFLFIWFIRYRKVEGFNNATMRFNMSLYGGTETTVEKGTVLLPKVPTTYAVAATNFACDTAKGEISVDCPDNRKQQCCRSLNRYIDIRKSNGIGPIDLSANVMKPPVKPIENEEWKLDAETRKAYEDYQNEQDMADTAADVDQDPLPPDTPPDFTAALGQFDAPVSEIPWDADNSTMLQKDAMWGYVSPQASKSIWQKVYTNNLLSNPGNLNGNDAGKFTYHSPLLDIDINDRQAAVATQVGEFLIMNAVFPKIQEILSIENVYKTIHGESYKPPTEIKKIQKPVGPELKSKVGAGKFKLMKKLFKNKFTKWFSKKLAAMTAKLAIKKAALIASLQAAVAAAGIASAGAAVPYAQSIAAKVAAVLEVVSNVVMVLTALLAPVLEQLIDGEGMCPNDYRSLDSMIPPAANMVIATFIPIIGDIVDMFYMYICFRKPRPELIAGLIAFVAGAFPASLALFITALVKDIEDKTPFIVLKSRLEGQPYVEDSTLSIYYANQIQPAVKGDGTGVIPPPLESFKIQKSDGSVVPRDWCNFANPIMMDRMANFYYKYSYANQYPTEDGRTSYEYISAFIGVIASSELSCDVVCIMKTVEFDPITGGNVTVTPKSPVYRRFYFVKALTDPQGYFTVTGCTNTDDCAPDAMTLSTEPDANYVPSVPKTFDYTKVATPGFDVNRFLAAEASTVVGMGLMMGGGIAGSVVAVVAADQIDSMSQTLSDVVSRRPKEEQVGSYIAQSGCLKTSQSGACSAKSFILRYTDDYYYINRGPVIEQSLGYVPEINFCSGIDGSGVLVTMDQCTDNKCLRAFITMYELEYPTRRVKVVRQIEPRAIFGCYYLMDTVSYNPDTNEEGIEYVSTEAIGYYTILNQTTCVRSLYAVGPYSTADDIYKVPRTITVPVSLRTPGVPHIRYPTRKPVKDKAGVITYVPINPAVPFIVPSQLPKSTVLGPRGKCTTPTCDKGSTTGAADTCPITTCDQRQVIDRLIIDFNRAHPEVPNNPNSNRKIQAVLRAWTSTPSRCDYEVEMLRFLAGKRVVQKETVSINVKKSDKTGEECVYTRVSDGSDRINSGTFIQPKTPALSAADTSGGILGYKSVVTAIQKLFNDTIRPILLSKPDVQLPFIATSANKSIESLSQLIFNEQTLKACPKKSCRDLDVLRAIALQYNADNLPSDQFYVDKNVMGKILKSGVADDTSCDVIFQNMQYQYDDVLQPPTSQVNTGMIYRFRLTPTGNGCGTDAYMVKPGDYIDVSDNAIGVRSASTTLFETRDGQYEMDANIGYTVPPGVPVDCGSAASLAAVKAGLPVPAGTTVPTYRSALWTYSRSNNVCEYKIKKDVTTGFGRSNQKTKLNVETFVTAVFGGTTKVSEYDLATIDFDEDGNTSVNGVDVTLPFLANYDEKTPSPLIDMNEKPFK